MIPEAEAEFAGGIGAVNKGRRQRGCRQRRGLQHRAPCRFCCHSLLLRPGGSPQQGRRIRRLPRNVDDHGRDRPARVQSLVEIGTVAHRCGDPRRFDREGGDRGLVLVDPDTATWSGGCSPCWTSWSATARCRLGTATRGQPARGGEVRIPVNSPVETGRTGAPGRRAAPRREATIAKIPGLATNMQLNVTSLLQTYAHRIRELRRANADGSETALAPAFQQLLEGLLPLLPFLRG